MTREKPIEQHLTRLVKRAGGRCYKWVSPGNKGVPDRIVFLRGMVFLVETKRTGVTKLRVAQQLQKRWLAEQGFDVVVLNSKSAVGEWVAMQVEALRPMRQIVRELTAAETDCDVLVVNTARVMKERSRCGAIRC